MGCSYFLPRLVGTSIASELMLTSRFIHAHRALSTNLVSEVVADNQLEAAAQLAVTRRLAQLDRRSVRTLETVKLSAEAIAVSLLVRMA